MLKKKSKGIFILCSLISGLILLQMGMYAMHVLFGWNMGFNFIQLCHDEMYSRGLTMQSFFLDGFVFYTFFSFISKLLIQLIQSKRAYKKLMVNRVDLLSKEINQEHDKENHSFHVISCTTPFAITMGFLKPKIFLSTGLLQLLDKNEIRAVVYHELHHRKHYDPLKTFLLSLFASILWYVPILKYLYKNYKIIREILADNHAICNLGTSIDLGSALLKLVKYNKTTALSTSYVSFADTSINYRIIRILNPQKEFSLELPFKTVLISIHVLILLCILFIPFTF